MVRLKCILGDNILVIFNLCLFVVGIYIRKVKDEKQRPPPLDNHYVYENGEDKPPTSYILGPLKLAKHLYPLSPLEVYYYYYNEMKFCCL